MYDDYPTVIESTLNQNYIYYIIGTIILLIIVIIFFISLAKVYKKANRSGISAIIPIYNIFVLLEITNLPKVFLLLYLIPGINLIINIYVFMTLSKFFRKSKLFGLGLAFLPIIFIPILAFNDNEYMGINLVAMEGKVKTVDVPKIVDDNEEKKPTVNENVDMQSKNINISIGGGVYQKEYTSNLLNVDEKQTINTNVNNTDTTVKEEANDTFLNKAFINENQINNTKPVIEDKKDNNVLTNIESVNYIETNTNTNQINKEPEYINCPKCNAKISADSKVCFLCGEVIK